MSLPKRLPYPGLRAFTREESDLFFGREGSVDKMVDCLALNRFMAVLGPSGSGKSSLVRTGLLDALELGLLSKAGSHWKIADMHPGGQPIRKLATALLSVKPGAPADQTDVDLMTTFLRQGPRSVVEWASAGNIPGGFNLLILVDQFEELFRYADYAQREEAEAFVAMLLESASTRDISIYVVITMRSEYLGACASIQGLAERISTGLYLAPRMDRDECREAIEGPAGVLGFKVEGALVNRLLNDLGSFAPWKVGEEGDLAAQLARQADQLPLMQHVLNRLWLRAESESTGEAVELKLADYDQIGGLSGALDAHGAEVISALGPNRLGQIESIFRALVSGNSLATAIRRPCRMSELIDAAGGRRDDVAAIITAFSAPGCNFLRTSDPSLASDAVIVDISHESLIRQWTPLRQWLEKEARDGAAWRRLVSAEERYTLREGGLLTGLDYQSSAAWWQTAAPLSAWALRHGGKFEAVRGFIQASQQAEDSHAAAERQRLKHERSLLVMGIATLAAVLFVVSGLGIFSWKKAKDARAEKSKSEATSRKLEATNGQLVEERNRIDATSKKLEATNGQLDAKSQELKAKNGQLDATLKEAVGQRKRADEAKASAEQDARRLTAALDDVSNLVNSDQYGNRVGAGNLRAELMKSIQRYQTDIEKQHRNMVGDASIVRDDYRSALASGSTGDAVRERDLLLKGYNDGLNSIKSTPAGKTPPASLLADFLDDGYLYASFLFDIGETDEGRAVLKNIQDVTGKYLSNPQSARLLVASAKIEGLLDRFDTSDRHARKALELAKSATTFPDANLDTQAFLTRAYLNLSYDTGSPEKDDLQKEGCKLADQEYASNQLDLRFIKVRVECLGLEGNNAASGDHRDRDTALEAYWLAEMATDQGLGFDPNSQALLLWKANTEDYLSFLFQGAGEEDVLSLYRLDSEKDFSKAVQGRPESQSNPLQLRAFYRNSKVLPFRTVTEEKQFYEFMIDSLSPTIKAYPKAPSLRYIAADSATNLSRLFATNSDQSEAENYLKKAIEDLSEVTLDDVSAGYSDDFSAYCSAYRQRAKLYGSTNRIDLMLADMSQLNPNRMSVCTSVLNKYPWDIDVREQIIGASHDAGEVFFKLQRYKEALPYLEYSSHWVDAGSTRLLARMYREGLGVDKSEQKTKELESLASEQDDKDHFLIFTSFGGIRNSVDISLRHWPADYPFEGIDDQILWLKARGGTVTPTLRKLQDMARDNKVPFTALAEYARNADNNNAKTGPNELAKPQYELAQSLYKQKKWTEAAQAAENALKLDPESIDILQLLDDIYHEGLFQFDRSFELNVRRVELGFGGNDFVENHLTTARFETCAELAEVVREDTSENRIRLVMSSLEFACLTGDNKPDAALAAGRRLRKDVAGLKPVGWTFSGTEHFISNNRAFAAKAPAWVSLFEALEEGDEKKALAALTALGVSG